ncbi:hypothetical protein BHQ18_24725 [Mycolicibacterium flavescens]|uniref:Uncharacterized protein n=1 Tax=Mycolicibacterium flavescens TaxID=1776 RepID=A0A1E3RBG9_MYCFV|nr:hypothetical protein BHQ18_24725 [Mycolicibacterium flavescens]
MSGAAASATMHEQGFRPGGFTVECKKCHRPLHDCSGCNGGRASGIGGKLTCSKCNSTGVVCSQHGGHWK